MRVETRRCELGPGVLREEVGFRTLEAGFELCSSSCAGAAFSSGDVRFLLLAVGRSMDSGSTNALERVEHRGGICEAVSAYSRVCGLWTVAVNVQVVFLFDEVA